MPVGFYLIPMTSGPYSRQNPMRPMYVDELQTNWTGHNVDALGVYVCKVNTTDAKHAQLAAQTGVRQLPAGLTWDTPISTLKNAQRNVISNWCSSKGIPFDGTETVGQLLMRVINSGLFDLGNTALNTTIGNLSPAQKDKVRNLCQRHGIPFSDTDTVRQLSDRCGRVFWPGDDETRVHVEEF